MNMTDVHQFCPIPVKRPVIRMFFHIRTERCLPDFSDCNCIRKVHALLPMRIIMKFSPSVHPEAENDTEEYANRTLSVDPSVFYRFICRRQSVSRYMGNHRINVNPSFYERRKRRHAPCGKNDGGRTYAPYGRPV